jgi:hypothetical protein
MQTVVHKGDRTLRRRKGELQDGKPAIFKAYQLGLSGWSLAPTGGVRLEDETPWTGNDVPMYLAS